MIQGLKEEIAVLKHELVRLRRDFHMHPELGFQEYRTSGIIKEYLEALGLETQIMARTGVVGLLRGERPGKTVLLRADMDALPVPEMLDKPYKSVQNGLSHACGHDAHVAILLVAAKILSKHRAELSGNIKFVFQPNEETTDPQFGALEMIKAGVLKNPDVNASFALHVWTEVEYGRIGVVNGAIMAGLEEFELTIYGKGGHTASPYSAVDPVLAAARIVEAVQSVTTREMSVFNPVIIMFGQIKGGTSRNVIPEKVELGGTIRYLLDNEERDKPELLEKFERVIKGVCLANKTDYEITYIPASPALVNSPAMVAVVREAARQTLRDEYDIIDYRMMGGEDYAEFARKVPSAFYFVGARNPEKGAEYPHHHPKFDIDEDALLTGVEMNVRTALQFLG